MGFALGVFGLGIEGLDCLREYELSLSIHSGNPVTIARDTAPQRTWPLLSGRTCLSRN